MQRPASESEGEPVPGKIHFPGVGPYLYMGRLGTASKNKKSGTRVAHAAAAEG
jgi:hypothetical protein